MSEPTESEIQQRNRATLDAFGAFLSAQGVRRETIDLHLRNLEFYASAFLLGYHQVALDEGHEWVGTFLGHWFICKAMWSDEASLRENIHGFRRFYEFLVATGRLPQARGRQLLQQLEQDGPLWIRRVQLYNDPEADLDTIWDDPVDSPAPSPQPAQTPGLVIQLSGAAAKYFKVQPKTLPKVDDLSAGYPWPVTWRCDMIAATEDERVHYLLLTNVETLYSVILPDRDRRSETMAARLVTLLEHLCQQRGLEWPTPGDRTFRLVRGQPRSLIGSQNQLKNSALHLLTKSTAGQLEELCHQLNDTPMLTLPEIMPAEALRARLEREPGGEKPPRFPDLGLS